MSASSKKKLRNAQEAAKMTERQLAEQKEAKKIKLYTIAFTLVLVALLVIAVTVGVTQTIRSSGIREKKTVAMTVDATEISNAELNYFYIDTINNFYSQNGSYAAMFGLDVTAPLNEQVMDESTGETWADYFLAGAKDSVSSVYAMNAAAAEAGHTLSEDELANVEAAVANLSLYANLYGYADGEAYLKAMYGSGADEESFRSYVTKSVMADSYYKAYGDSLTYTDADLRAAEAENFNAYSSFSYDYYYLSVSRFLEGGTTAEDGTVTYSDEEKAAAVAAAEEAAKTLTDAKITTADALNEAIASLSINEGTEAACTTYDDYRYSYISSIVANWLADESRKDGDRAYLPTTTVDENGNETVNAYYVVYYHGTNDNAFALKNVRHILVGFEGGTTDENGTTTYSDEEKAAAKATAEELLKEWKAGDATEDSFAALATEKTTDTGSAATGGLYEDIYPGQMVAAFEDWCFDASRKTGDTGIVETEYGYHIMYFVGDSETTYRDYLIETDLSTNDLNEWYTGIITSPTVVDGDTKYIRKDLILGTNN